MTFVNEGRWDRAVRIIAGVLLLGSGWALALSAFGVVVFATGAIVLATGLVGWCPAYTFFGISTVRTTAGQCPNCAVERHRV